MKVESMQQVNSSYQSQGSANVAAQAVPAKSGTSRKMVSRQEMFGKMDRRATNRSVRL